MTGEAVTGPIPHGAKRVSRVIIDAYNVELRSDEGFVGNRASKRAFEAILDDWRERLRKIDADPLGETATDEISFGDNDALAAHVSVLLRARLLVMLTSVPGILHEGALTLEDYWLRRSVRPNAVPVVSE